MEKIILVDGNNLLFRSYYATAYNGNFMKNSKGFPTNALFGFHNMINKIIQEENPTYILVAFDKGKTFRHDKYEDYKGGREQTPDELKMQFPLAKKLLTNMGIKYYEMDNYEADDIIGTMSTKCDGINYNGLIISSDKDLLQLINENVEIKLLKSKDYILYNEKTFKQDYGIDPIKVIDLKSLMGDSSDNIPGVKGIGEKTALKLLQEYNSLDGVYENVSNMTPKMQEKLLQDKENAYMSYDLATIYKKAPIDITIEDIKIKQKNTSELIKMYEELEFYSFLKKIKEAVDEDIFTDEEELKYEIVDENTNVLIDEDSSIYLEILGENYHTCQTIGIAIYNKSKAYFLTIEELVKRKEILNHIKYTYDHKKAYVSLKKHGLCLDKVHFDLKIAAYLLDYNVKDDIAYLANTFGGDIPFYDDMFRKLKSKDIFEKIEQPKLADECIKKAKFIYDKKDEFMNLLDESKMTDLFNNIEMPLSYVLGNMENVGVYVDSNTLDEMGIQIDDRIKQIEKDIYELAGLEFNISSPKQLGEILFDKLELNHGKKNKKGYSTSIDILNKLIGTHPIIEKIIDYRTLTKLYTTYIEGLKNYICEDSKIHTIFTQTLTKTGRLSSIDPNLQNIPIRYEEGRLIRKAFIPSKDSIIISADYSQIELRILAHMANIESLITAFKQEIDIHTKTASDIFHINIDEVTKNQRRIAKAVNFGIIYGISKYGLSENLGISVNEAGEFIDKYFKTYPGIKDYMDKTIKDAYSNGYVVTMMNRKRIIPELNNKNRLIKASGERIALNTPIQGTSADIIKKAMVDIEKEFKKQNIKSKMIIQVHDELIFDCLKEEKDKVINIVTDKMENALKLKLPLKIELSYGDNWYEAK